VSNAGREESPPALDVMEGTLSIVKLDPADPVPHWVERGTWYSVTRTPEECSIVCDTRCVPDGVSRVGPWRGLKVEGPLDFAMIGVLRRIAVPLADAEISIFVVSTFDTDYVLVRDHALARAASCLNAAGIIVRGLN